MILQCPFRIGSQMHDKCNNLTNYYYFTMVEKFIFTTQQSCSVLCLAMANKVGLRLHFSGSHPYPYPHVNSEWCPTGKETVRIA